LLTIDGSLGEGGGQILRTSLSLAAITGVTVKITNIRASREKPGLRPQHLTGALAVAEICGAEIEGAEVGSSEIIFRPRRIRPGNYEFDVSSIRSSAGSVNLVLQTILWPLALAEKRSRVVIRGGTHVPHAPTSNYIMETFLPIVARMGVICNYTMVKAGYYPEGGGEIRAEIRSADFSPLAITERSEPIGIELTSAVSNLSQSIAERQMKAGSERVRAAGFSPEERIKNYPSPGKGTVFFASLEAGQARAGFQSIGEVRRRAEHVAEEACDEMDAYLRTEAALDKHLADQLIIPMALAAGRSVFTTCEVTEHLLTNIAVVEKFFDVHFHVSAGVGQPGTVERVEG
jgi:RNA 3'-terminal phosphate cyclase (ATP)